MHCKLSDSHRLREKKRIIEGYVERESKNIHGEEIKKL